MTVFTRTWNAAYEAQPADNEDINLGATRIRNFKEDIQERVAVDHSFDGDEFDGQHEKVTLRPQNAAPTVEAPNGYVWSAVIAGVTELFYRDSNGNNIQLTKQGWINPDFPANISVSGTALIANLTVVNTAKFANDDNVYIIKSGGSVIFNAAPNTYMIFNGVAWAFVINGVTVGQFP